MEKVKAWDKESTNHCQLRDQGQHKKRFVERKCSNGANKLRVCGTEVESFNYDDGYCHAPSLYLERGRHSRTIVGPQSNPWAYKGMHSCKTSQSSIFISYENQKPNQCQIKKQKVRKLNTIKEETVPFTPLKCESQNARFFVNSIEPFTSEYMHLSLLPNQEDILRLYIY
ncbi:hypothetical protein MTR67_042607 [Solanum verrucosum]|uniref:Uncharacterized protein n=1 Tax=Solanum verrucosum TaxID=315347 RepID=A0AAF0UMW3_SOLVR|nr:hypothetical protein MTR67_042607 [Solanum verrucosum]